MAYTQDQINTYAQGLRTMDFSAPGMAQYLDDFKAGKVGSLGSGAMDMTAPKAPTTDPNYQALLDKQKGIASDFRKNLPQYGQTLGNQFEQQSRQQLAGSLKSTDQDFNRRGLLYSGARIGNEAGQQAQNASDISAGKQQINSGLLNQANQLDQNALQTASGVAGLNTGQYQVQVQQDVQSLANQISNLQASTQAQAGLMGGLSSVAGLGLAYGINNPSTQTLSTIGSPTSYGGVLGGYYQGLA